MKRTHLMSKAATVSFAGLLAGAVLAVNTPIAGADPNLGLPGQIDDGTPNCGIMGPRALALYIGSDRPAPPRALDETFTTAPAAADWCNVNAGYSSTTFGPDGVTFHTPITPAEGAFPDNNAELVANPITVPEMTQVYKVRGSNLATINGSSGWGISNRTGDPMALDLAWFAWNGSNGPVDQVMARTGIADVLTQLTFETPTPTGFGIYVKRSGVKKVTYIPLDPALLAADHSYAIRVHAERVEFFVDGGQVGVVTSNTPTGLGVDALGGALPMTAQMWLDTQTWNPFPILDYSPTANSVTLAHFRQGPVDSTPLVLP